jgi:hypothetical protein
MSNITFSNIWSGEVEFLPKPAVSDVPIWYKGTHGTLTERELQGLPVADPMHPVVGTIKHCMPVLDAITAGYLLYTPVDLIISSRDGQPYYEWFGANDLIGWHPKIQAENHPLANTEMIPKFLNPWSIKTDKGTSCLVTHPFHRDDLPFITMTGIVDTDSYNAPIALVFTLKDPMFEGIIPAGTPMAQVVPFKRDSWSMSIGEHDDKLESSKQSWRVRKLNSLRYKNAYWSRKQFR